MKEQILLASMDAQIIDELASVLSALDFTVTTKTLKNISIIKVPQNEFHSALMSIAPFIEVVSEPQNYSNLFWAYKNKKQDTLENVVAIAKTLTIDEFKKEIDNLGNSKGLTT